MFIAELKLDVVATSKMLLHIYQTARNHIAEENSILPKSYQSPIYQIPIDLKMERAVTSETSLTIYQTTRYQSPEDPILESVRSFGTLVTKI
jgi:hypothetical protein